MSLASAPPHSEQEAIPPELKDSVQRHQRHLAALVESLRAAGVGEDVIEVSVAQLLDSYRDELTIAMRAMVSGKARA
jgi:hypothetical protein